MRAAERVKVRGQFEGTHFLLPPCGSQGLNSSHKGCYDSNSFKSTCESMRSGS